MLENIICIDEFCIKSIQLLQPFKSRVELKIYIKMINFYLLENNIRYEVINNVKYIKKLYDMKVLQFVQLIYLFIY